MKLSDIKATSDEMVSVTSDEVDQFEVANWVIFPSGYRDYITKFGEGVLGDFVRMYPPRRIEKELHEWRKRINKYWFWEESEKLFPKDRAIECVIIGDTVNGDEIVFHPARPNKLFVLPRDLETAAEIGDNLEAAIEWILSSGELTEPIDRFNFEPIDSRLEESENGATKKPLDPEGESFDDIAKLGKDWAKRRSMKKRAKAYFEACIADKDFRRYVEKRYLEKGFKLQLVYEAVVTDSKGMESGCYLIAYDLMYEPIKYSLARMTWHGSDIHEGGEILPNRWSQDKIDERETDPN